MSAYLRGIYTTLKDDGPQVPLLSHANTSAGPSVECQISRARVDSGLVATKISLQEAQAGGCRRSASEWSCIQSTATRMLISESQHLVTPGLRVDWAFVLMYLIYNVHMM
jgi:hypothetical protein